MIVKPILLTAAIAISLYASGNHGYPFSTENIPASQDAPGGLDTAKIPLFIGLGFDDNRYADGVDWVQDTLLKGRFNHAGLGNKATYDGTPVVVDFNVIGNSDYEWSADAFTAPLPSERPVTASWRKAYDAGTGVNNHTWTHNYNLSDLKYDEPSSERPSLLMELGYCQKYMVNIMGMPVEHIYGFRTPYLASSVSDNASYRATRDIGIMYDCTQDNVMQGNQPAVWARPYFPGTMNNGWGPWTSVAIEGLWEVPNAIYQVQEGGTFSDKGFDSGPKGWPGGASAEAMFKQMKSAIVWAYNKNRASVDLGLHSDYYSNEAQNTAGTAAAGFSTSLADRQKALVMVLDFVRDSLPDARVVKKVDIVRWMRNPVELQDLGRNDELTFQEGSKTTTLSNSSSVTLGAGSKSTVSGNSATVTVEDQKDNWITDAYAGMKWDLDGNMNGTHAIRVTYKSDMPLRVIFEQDNISDGQHYGFGLPTTEGETKTVELPIVTDFIEPPRPYKGIQTLDLSKVTAVSMVAQVLDTTMSGAFTADVELFGGDVSVISQSANALKQGVTMQGFSSTGTNVTVPSTGNYKIELFTANGQRLLSKNASFNQLTNAISWNSSLAKGIYLVKVTGKETSVTLRKAFVQ